MFLLKNLCIKIKIAAPSNGFWFLFSKTSLSILFPPLIKALVSTPTNKAGNKPTLENIENLPPISLLWSKILISLSTESYAISFFYILCISSSMLKKSLLSFLFREDNSCIFSGGEISYNPFSRYGTSLSPFSIKFYLFPSITWISS